jgi:WD40 repeat protein
MVRLWSIESKELLMVLEGGPSNFLRDTPFYAARNALTPLSACETGHTDYVGAVACWKGNLPIIVSGSSDGTIKAWNTQTGALIATGEGHTRDAWALGVTNEPNARILSGSFDRTVKVWDLNPVLRELNWQRRRDYCLFLAMLGFCSAGGDREALLTTAGTRPAGCFIDCVALILHAICLCAL